MSETELPKYIYKNLVDNAESFQWKIIIDSYKNAIEIYFTISMESILNEHVQDINAQVNQPEQLIFEDIVTFYDETNNKIIPENYLSAIPMNTTTGIEKGYVDAFLKQLNIVISEGVSQLREFLKDNEQQEFSLSWNDENFKNTINTLRKTNKYSTELLSFSTPQEQSLINQLKEERYDGLERI